MNIEKFESKSNENENLKYVLAALRTAHARLRLAQAQIEEVGAGVKAGIIDYQTACERIFESEGFDYLDDEPAAKILEFRRDEAAA